MKRTRKIPIPASSAEEREIAVADIDCADDGARYEEQSISDGGAAGAPPEALKKRAAYLLLNGVPPLVVNEEKGAGIDFWPEKTISPRQSSPVFPPSLPEFIDFPNAMRKFLPSRKRSKGIPPAPWKELTS